MQDFKIQIHVKNFTSRADNARHAQCFLAGTAPRFSHNEEPAPMRP